MQKNRIENHRLLIGNILGFQLIWWLIILLGNQAIAVAMCLIALHCYCHSDNKGELRTIILVGLVGYFVDTMLTLAGWFSFPQYAHTTYYSTALPPVWLMVLWMAFGATLNNSLAFFHRRTELAILAGGLSGPLSYLAAEKLGAVTFPNEVNNTMLLLAIIWAGLFPFALWLSRILVTHSGRAYAQ